MLEDLKQFKAEVTRTWNRVPTWAKVTQVLMIVTAAILAVVWF